MAESITVDSLVSLGEERLLKARFSEAAWALDAALVLSPGIRNPGLWQRGLACYYSGQYEFACQQFQSNMDVNGLDIEEVVWHFLSQAKRIGFEAARKNGFLELRPSHSDLSTVPPMAEILKLYKGESSVEEVLHAAVDSSGAPLESYNGTNALAYAHFYIGLYYQVQGKEQAKYHLKTASELQNPDFMGKLMNAHYKRFCNPTHECFAIGSSPDKSYKSSRIILGGWQLSEGHVITCSCSNLSISIQSLIRAYESGITAFDCGDIYTGVEALYGHFIKALAARGAGNVHIHTKLVPDLDAIRSGSVDEHYVRSCVRRSLNRLGVECVSLLQLHWWDLRVPGYLELAKQVLSCANDGLVRQIGLTNFDTETTKELVAAGIPIATTQVQYSLLDRRPHHSGLVTLCLEKGIKILAYGVLAGGFLTDTWLGKAKPQVEDLANRSLVKYLLIIDEFGGWTLFQELLAVLHSIADQLGSTIAMVAIQYILKQDAVGGVIIGAHSSKHLKSTVSATELRLSVEHCSLIESVLICSKGPLGPVYSLEREVDGRHAQIMKYNLNHINRGPHLEELCTRYLQIHFSAYPTEATRTGYRLPHCDASTAVAVNYDHSVDIVSSEGIAGHCKRMRALIDEANSIDSNTLSNEQLVDLKLIISQLQLQLVLYENVQSYKKDPMVYLPLNAILYLLPAWGDESKEKENCVQGSIHPGAIGMTVHQRLSALLSRLQSIPASILHAVRNLTSPVKVFVKTALKTCRSFSSFLANDLPQLCAEMGSDELVREITFAAKVGAICIDIFSEFLSNDLLPRSNDITGVGKEVYCKILKYSHFIDSYDDLLKLGYKHFDEVKLELEKIAQEIDPTKTWQEITKTVINSLHPMASQLLSAYMSEIHRARDHMIQQGLVAALPDNEVVHGFTTPSFLTPFSPVGDYLNPSPFAGIGSDNQAVHTGHLMLHSVSNQPLEEQEKLLRGHDYCWISVVSPHESYPGHHVQALLAQKHSRVLRKYHESVLFYEGWGLYTEQLAYETGFYHKELCLEREERTISSDEFEKLTRLTQLRLRLWRAARVILDAKLNTGEFSVQECREFLHREVMLNEGASVGEVYMYVSRPCYAPCYVAGYVMLMALREKMKQKFLEDNRPFCLKEFHDLILSKGCLPFELLQTLV